MKWTFSNEIPSEIVSRSDNEIPPKNSKAVTLNIEVLSTETAGYYVCTAVNEFGKSELGVVVIGARPTLPGPDFQNETVITARAGDSVELGCDVIVDSVVTEVAPVRRFWEKDGKILVTIFCLSYCNLGDLYIKVPNQFKGKKLGKMFTTAQYIPALSCLRPLLSIFKAVILLNEGNQIQLGY